MSPIKSFEPTFTGLGKDAPGSPITAEVRPPDPELAGGASLR